MTSEKKTLKSKVGSKISGVGKHADMLGAIVWYLGTFAAVGQVENVGIVQEVMYRHINAVTIHNVPNLEKQFIPSIADPVWGGLVKMGAGALIGGVVVGALPSLIPWQHPVANAAKKAGFGMIIGAVGAIVVGKLSEGSGGGTQLGGHSGGGSAGGSVNTTGLVTGVRGAFNPPAPSASGWVRPR